MFYCILPILFLLLYCFHAEISESIFRCIFVILCLLAYILTQNTHNIGGVMVSVLTSSAVGCGLEPRLNQTKYYQIGICCFSAKHTH